MAAIIEGDRRWTDPNRRSLISWGAIIAGLVFVLGIGWFMLLLGSAIGISVINVENPGTMTDGLDIATMGWMLLTDFISLFLGAWLAGRLAGQPDRAVGMWHGATLWGAATILMVLLTYAGISGLFQMGQSLVNNLAQVTGEVSASLLPDEDSQNRPGRMERGHALTRIQAELRRVARQGLGGAQGGSQGGARDTEGLWSTLTMQLVGGDTDAVMDTLEREAGLSRAEAQQLVSRVSGLLQQELNQLRNELNLSGWATSVRQGLLNQLSALNEQGRLQTDPQTLSRAVQQLDDRTIQQLGWHLVQGEPRAARQVLAANTPLTDAELEGLVQGLQQEAQQYVEALQGSLDLPTSLDWIQQTLRREASGIIAGLDQPGGARVSRREVARVMAQLDLQTLEAVARPLLQGNTRAARDVLAVRTDLTEQQIDALVQGVESEARQTTQALENTLTQYAATARDYVQSVLWTVVLSSLVGLLIAILGGRLGAGRVRRPLPERGAV